MTAAEEMQRDSLARAELFLQRFEDLVVRLEAAAARVGAES